MTVYRVLRASDTVIADTDGQVSTYDEADDVWEPREPGGGSGGSLDATGQPSGHVPTAQGNGSWAWAAQSGGGATVKVGGAAPSSGLWLDTGTSSTSVTATAPTFTDLDGTEDDTYTIPTTTGVEYLVGGVVEAAGTYPASGTVTVTAQALTGYTLTGTSSWSHTFSTTTTPISVTPTGPTWTDDTVNGGGTWTTPTQTGVVYSPASGTATPGQTVTVTASPASGYSFPSGATTSWPHTFPAAPSTNPAQAYTDAVVASAPITFYRLNEPAGTTPVDTMGNSTATVVGTVTQGSTSLLAPDTSAHFPQSSTGGNHIKIGAPQALEGLAAWSVEWVSSAWQTGGSTSLVNKSNNSHVSFHISLNTGVNRINVHGKQGALLGAANDAFTGLTGPWHGVVTYDGDVTVKVYVNGVLKATIATTQANAGMANDPTQLWEIGRKWAFSGGADSYNRSLYGVAFYNRTLTAAEVADHFAATGL